MAQFEFGGSVYRNSADMHTAIAETWISANGLNSRTEMLEWIAERAAGQLADDAIAGWFVEGNDQDLPEFDRDALIRAIADVQDNFDRHFPPEA